MWTAHRFKLTGGHVATKYQRLGPSADAAEQGAYQNLRLTRFNQLLRAQFAATVAE
jgi:hypothetical protein